MLWLRRRDLSLGWLMIILNALALAGAVGAVTAMVTGGRAVPEPAGGRGTLTVVAYSAGCLGDSARIGDALHRQGRYLLPDALRALADPCRILGTRYLPNLIVNGAKTNLRDCFNNNASSVCTGTISTLKFHGLGTSSTAAAGTDTGCTTELTTQYNPDNTRATGSQTTNGTNVYRTVGTNTVDATVGIQEWCLFNQAATGGGNLWSHVVFSIINLNSGDGLQTTYDLTLG